MSDAPPVSNTAFADALARARQLAAKLGAGGASAAATSPPHQMQTGIKRGASSIGSNDSEPDTKRLASLNDPFGAQLAAMKNSGGGGSYGGSLGGGGGSSAPGNFVFPVGMGITGSGKSCMEEVRIPDGLVGLIIGRGGEQVSRIQAETGCKVQVAPDSAGGKDRPCYLQGTKESIEKAKDLIMEIVNSKSHEVSLRPGLGATKPGLAGMTGGPGTTSIEMTIPGAKVGLVIGKGGETIRNLQDKSGTKMFILQENMFEECDKPLRIVGEPDLVEHARQLVMDLINDTPPKQDFFKKNDYGDSDGLGGGGGGGGGGMGRGGGRQGVGFNAAGLETMKFPVPKISVGLIIGKGGEMIKRIQVETGAKVQFDPVNQNLGDMDEQLAIITGKPDQLRLAQLKIEELVETALHGPTSRGGGGGGHGGDRREGGGGGGWGGHGGGGGGHHRGREDGDSERMHVPVGRVGMVIGKGGETIRTINQQSGAHCEIDRNGPNDGPERIFMIRGSRQQIEHAKQLIMEKVNTLPPKHGGPGGHDSYGGGQSQGWGSGGGGGGGYGGGGSQGQGGWGSGNGQSAGGGAGAAGGDSQAQWAAYYAQYYNQAQAVPAASTTTAGPAGAGQTDYTQQWIEYLRAQGQHQQADLLEKQMKQSTGTNGSSIEAPGTTSAPSGANGGGGAAATTAGQNGADYSQAWADHYRSIGDTAKAEQIENYIKQQKAQASGGSAAGPAAGGDAAAYQNYYQQYYQQYYGAGGYPGAGGTAPPGTAAVAAPGTEGYLYEYPCQYVIYEPMPVPVSMIPVPMVPIVMSPEGFQEALEPHWTLAVGKVQIEEIDIDEQENQCGDYETYQAEAETEPEILDSDCEATHDEDSQVQKEMALAQEVENEE